MRRAIQLLTFAGALCLGNLAHAVVISWSGPDSFNDVTQTFGAITTGGLTSITDVSGGQAGYHDHGSGSVTVTYQVRLNNVWTTIFTDTVTSSTVVNNFTGASWSQGTVNGIRLLSAPNQNWSYHFWRGAKFHFAAATVPEPAGLGLLGLGLVGLSVARRSRRV